MLLSDWLLPRATGWMTNVVARESSRTTLEMCTEGGGRRTSRVRPHTHTLTHHTHTLPPTHSDGFGELKFVSNDVYRGYWKDGVRNGDVSTHTRQHIHTQTPSQGKILYANGDTFDGHFTVGHIEGRGVLKCQNGVEYNGEWKHSQVRSCDLRLYSDTPTATGQRSSADFHW